MVLPTSKKKKKVYILFGNRELFAGWIILWASADIVQLFCFRLWAFAGLLLEWALASVDIFPFIFFLFLEQVVVYNATCFLVLAVSSFKVPELGQGGKGLISTSIINNKPYLLYSLDKFSANI